MFKFNIRGGVNCIKRKYNALFTSEEKNYWELRSKKTHIFKFNVAEVIKDLKDEKGVNDFLLGNRNGQINKTSSFPSEHEISFLQYAKQTKDKDLVAFLENYQSTNKQRYV
ncbi:Predicted protein [Wolbachia endosymbiont strain TRS of Brugia malayi]|uniref:hypothetical protein n=1 Tax=Wolbachia endosymbiont of Brugia malayi TaxID=80849 RepID=UPI00004C945F|nr:hypothetical protein [Wolbachia endosymbiont of Brugia malayi]AAW71183.1 Predicted protein [Wolbachia endosymbiont strain TRS of Brugia malayi]